MSRKNPKPIALVILDGWGCRKETDANAIAAAHKPNWDQIASNHLYTEISGSGQCVGLPDNQMGNSEVGHLNIGAGRVVPQDLTRVDSAIDDGSFDTNPIFLSTLKQASETGRTVHIMGLLSPGGVHSHESHIYAMINLVAKHNIPACYVHAFLDGRDTPPKSAKASISKLDSICQQVGNTKIASLVGRYYAMDRDNRWERVAPAYHLLVEGAASHQAATAEDGLEQAYARGESDEFVKPTAIHSADTTLPGIRDGDVVIFMNFRADRARELTRAFIDPDFDAFERKRHPKLAAFVCLAEYDSNFDVAVAFPSISLKNILAQILSENDLKQLRIAETEKYAHVTFFFNGGVEQPFAGENRVLIPSPKVATYDLQPEMSAPALTDRLVHEIKTGDYDVIICNYANPDMVGHTGDMAATIKAIEVVDLCLGQIKQALNQVGGELLITADHGNAELMYNPDTDQPHTAHTSQLVPFIYIGRDAEIANKNGKLSDIAPTLLHLLSLPKPSEMTGQSLLKIR